MSKETCAQSNLAQELNELFNLMFHQDPELRITTEDLVSHPWMLKKPDATQKDVAIELGRRLEAFH